MSTTFGDRLRSAIRYEGYTSLVSFGHQVGLKSPDINRYLNGSRLPGLDLLARMLVALPNTDARRLIVGEQ